MDLGRTKEEPLISIFLFSPNVVLVEERKMLQLLFTMIHFDD